MDADFNIGFVAGIMTTLCMEFLLILVVPTMEKFHIRCRRRRNHSDRRGTKSDRRRRWGRREYDWRTGRQS